MVPRTMCTTYLAHKKTVDLASRWWRVAYRWQLGVLQAHVSRHQMALHVELGYSYAA